MAGRGRHLWKLSSSTGQWMKIAWGHVWLDSEYVQGCRICHLPGQLMAMFLHTHTKSSFLLSCGISCVPVSTFSLLSLGTTEKCLASAFLSSPIRVLHTWIRFPGAFSYPAWAAPVLSSSPHITAAVPSSSSGACTGCALVSPPSSHTQESRADLAFTESQNQLSWKRPLRS